MKNEFLLVHKSILPQYYEIVIEARNMIENENQSVTDVCKKLGISRNTYYKYKDFVFKVNDDEQKKLIVQFKVLDVPGVLSQILTKITSLKGNILTINQDMPIQGFALITIMIDWKNIEVSLDELMKNLKEIDNVKDAEVIFYA